MGYERVWAVRMLLKIDQKKSKFSEKQTTIFEVFNMFLQQV
jgi:hypothetical protein